MLSISFSNPRMDTVGTLIKGRKPEIRYSYSTSYSDFTIYIVSRRLR